MNVQANTDTGVTDTELVVRIVPRAIASALVIAAILFIAAWRLNWIMAWALVGIQVISFIVNSLVLDRELLDERTKSKEDTKPWDKALVAPRAIVGLVLLIVAGLDMRWGWTRPSLSLAIQIIGMGVFVLGQIMLSWAMGSNRFFSDIVRIQEERGHAVETRGPYRYVRHPGYVGGILYALGVPFMLGSLWALIPGGLSVLLLVIRTALEDKTLQEELEGYQEYTQQTRYRLLPGVW